jgi:hypothetical protein
MSQAGTGVTGPACVLVAVAVGRNTWVSKQATLHYESSRLVKAEGIDFPPAGPNGVSGTLYVVKDCLCRDNRRLMRVERHKIVDGKVVDVQNWGEVEDAGPSSTLAPETSTGPFSPQPLFPENTVFQAVPACLAG